MIAEKKIPNLMPFQMEPFNGDKYIEREVIALQAKYNLSKAIELGTCLGSTAIFLAKHFELLHTIEINPEFQEIALQRIEESCKLTKNTNVVCNWLADSVEILPRIFRHEVEPYRIKEPCLIFIDSHWGESVPILQELEIIAKAKIPGGPVIMIHDFLVPGRADLGYDVYNNQALTFDWIKPYVEKIYGKDGYGYHYNKEAVGAKRGVIYIYPV